MAKDQRAVQGCHGQDCRPTQGCNGLQDHCQAAWWEGDNSWCDYSQMEETKNNYQSSSVWGSRQDLTSWSFNDHENGEESARTAREDLVNDIKAAGTIVTKKTMGKHTTPWRTEILRRQQGPPAQESTCTDPSEVYQWFRGQLAECCGQIRPKSSSLASTQLSVFGGGGMLPMTQRTPPPPSNTAVETLCFGGVFLLRGQDNCTASKVRWDGAMYQPAKATKNWLKKKHN